MAEEQRAETHSDVQILVAVDVPDLRTNRLVDDDEVLHLFPERTETGSFAAVGEIWAILLREALRVLCFPVDAFDQRVQVALLFFSQRARCGLADLPERNEWLFLGFYRRLSRVAVRW